MGELEPGLIYVADPMCSWCWGFAPVLDEVRATLGLDVPLRYVMGGLAPDSVEPMPPEVREYVQSAWDAVEVADSAVRTGCGSPRRREP